MADTVDFLPEHTNMPGFSTKEASINSALDIVDPPTKPSPAAAS